MKRFLGLSVVALLVFGLSASHMMLSAAPSENANKVAVCHVGVDEETGEETTTVIEISGNGKAVEKHVENHGDCIIGALEDRSLIGTECDATDAEGGGEQGDESDGQCDNPPTS